MGEGMREQPREIILEQHLFKGDGNQFKCSQCNKPRCFHPEPISLPISNPQPFTPKELRELNSKRIRSSWRGHGTTGPLTDKKISRYAKRGYYSLEFKEARKQFLERKYRRVGSFIDLGEGRLIYRP